MKMDFNIARRSAQRRSLILGFAVAATVAIVAASINPIGYIGAGADDTEYLAAARCWAAHAAPCIPATHWATRWPVIAPVAAFISLVGESRFSVQLAPALWWSLALVMTGWLGSAWFGWRSGALAVALLGSAPTVAFTAFEPNIDIPELALQLCALAAATSAYRRQSRMLACTAGVFAALAVQARETSLLFVGASALMWFSFRSDKRQVLVWAIAGFASAELAEILVYWAFTGDPLLRLRLALGHTNIVTDQLPEGFHSNRGPLLNPDFMRSWKREMHITLWWPLDPWLNLYASPRSGMILSSGTLALAVLGRAMSCQERRGVLRLVCGAALVAIGLVYVLAVDPKSRMFMSLYAAISISAGAAISHALRDERKLLAAALASVPICAGLFVMSQYSTSAPAEAWARTWIERYGSDIEVFPGAASYLTFVPEVRSLQPSGSGRRYLLTTAVVDCDRLIDPRPSHRNGVVIDSFSSSLGRLCLFEYLPVRPSIAEKPRQSQAFAPVLKES